MKLIHKKSSVQCATVESLIRKEPDSQNESATSQWDYNSPDELGDGTYCVNLFLRQNDSPWSISVHDHESAIQVHNWYTIEARSLRVAPPGGVAFKITPPGGVVRLGLQTTVRIETSRSAPNRATHRKPVWHADQITDRYNVRAGPVCGSQVWYANSPNGRTMTSPIL